MNLQKQGFDASYFYAKSSYSGSQGTHCKINSHFHKKKNRKKIILEKNNICIIVYLYKHQSLQLSQCLFAKNRNVT